MSPEVLRGWLDRLIGVRVAVVGDVMVDRFVYGDVHRVSAEAPVPVLAHVRETVMLGGAGNVARNVAAVGGVAALVGVLGDDQPGRDAIRLVGQESGVENYLVPDPGRPTTVKTRFSSGSQQLLRLDSEATHSTAGEVEAKVVRGVAEASRDSAAILLSDYGKGVVTPAVIAACARAAALGSGADRRFQGAGLFPLRRGGRRQAERRRARPGDGPPDRDRRRHRGRSRRRFAQLPSPRDPGHPRGQRHVAGRPGRAGAPLLAPAARGVRHRRAGDTALAVAGLALAAGADLPTAIELALIACGVVVQKAGVATASADEMVQAERAANLNPHESKVASLTGMVDQVGRWRAQGLKVGFTNGCFDILHPGHVNYLAEARSWCDRLVVGLNTDRS